MDTLTKHWWGDGKAPPQLWCHGPLFSKPWFSHLLPKNSPPYEDGKPTNFYIKPLTPDKPTECRKCRGKKFEFEELPDGDIERTCLACSILTYFTFDKVIMKWVEIGLDKLIYMANCDVLKSDKENYYNFYYRDNRERLKAQHRKWNEENKERCQVTQRLWKQAHRDEINQRRRERKAAQPQWERDAYNRQRREARAEKKGILVGATA